MKAVILAGGKGMRLYPLTKTINKHIVPVGSSPMLWYPLWSLYQAGFREVLIITDRKDAGDIVGICGSGKDLGMDISYRIQDQAGGVAEALGLAEAWVKKEPFLCLLADNVFTYPLAPFFLTYQTDPKGCKIAGAKVSDPLRYALIDSDNLGRVKNIVEKPKTAISDIALTGIAIFDEFCFQVIHDLKPSARNELEYTDVLNAYRENNDLSLTIIPDDQWVDAGTFSGLDKATQMVQAAKFIPFPTISRQDL